MGKNTVIATEVDHIYERIAKVAEKQGYTHRRAFDGREAALLSREHLPNTVFLDYRLSPQNGVRGARAIRDMYGIDTTIVIGYESGNRKAAQIGVGENGADMSLLQPVGDPKIADLLTRYATDDPAFNGDQRVTFIDKRGNQEYQTPHGVARQVEHAETDCVVVLGEYVPDWATSHGVEVVVGKSGTLSTAFSIVGWESKPSHEYGLPSQYWFAAKPL